MRINELFESSDQFKEFVDPESESGLAYDLAEDVVFFMNNDDDTYRQHVFPSVIEFLEMMKHNQKTSPAMFKNAAINSYKNYYSKFPIRELPVELNGQLAEAVCKKFYEELCRYHTEGTLGD